MDILGAVAKGKDHQELLFFEGLNEPYVISPLTAEEADKAFSIPLGNCRDKYISELVVKVRLKILSLETEVDMSKVNVGEFKRFLDETDYWTAYFGLRGNQPPEFSDIDPETLLPNGYSATKEILHVHKIAEKVREITGVAEDRSKKIEYFIKSASGKILATVHWTLNVPITDKAWKLTPLQMEFLSQSHPSAPKRYSSWEEVDDGPLTWGNYMSDETMLKKVNREFADPSKPPEGDIDMETGRFRDEKDKTRTVKGTIFG